MMQQEEADKIANHLLMDFFSGLFNEYSFNASQTTFGFKRLFSEEECKRCTNEAARIPVSLYLDGREEALAIIGRLQSRFEAAATIAEVRTDALREAHEAKEVVAVEAAEKELLTMKTGLNTLKTAGQYFRNELG